MPTCGPPRSRPAGPGCWSATSTAARASAAFDAMLVLIETGRRLAGVELLGHLPASELLDKGGYDGIEDVAAGTTRAAFVPAQPPGDLDDGWTVDSRDSMARAAAPTVDGSGAVSGEVPWVVDAPGADLLVVVAVRDGAPVVVAVPTDGGGVSVEEVVRYDPTRRLGHVTFDGAAGHRARRRRRDRDRAGVEPRAGAARGRVGRRGRDVPGDGGPVREGALHVRPADRLLPGGQARPRRGHAAAGERALAPVLRGLGARVRARRVRDRRERGAVGGRRGARLRARARTSPSTAASARRGSTTRRCSSAARSCRAGCSAGRRARPTASPASCCERDGRRGPARPPRASRRGATRYWSHDRCTFPLPEGHRFPIRKYGLLRERVEQAGLGDGVRVPAARRGRRSRSSTTRRTSSACAPAALGAARAARPRPAVVARARRARAALVAGHGRGGARRAARRLGHEPRRRHAPRRSRVRPRLLPVQRRRARDARPARRGRDRARARRRLRRPPGRRHRRAVRRRPADVRAVGPRRGELPVPPRDVGPRRRPADAAPATTSTSTRSRPRCTSRSPSPAPTSSIFLAGADPWEGDGARPPRAHEGRPARPRRARHRPRRRLRPAVLRHARRRLRARRRATPSRSRSRPRSSSPTARGGDYTRLARGHSSAGRAPALQAGGRRFDPGWLHHSGGCCSVCCCSSSSSRCSSCCMVLAEPLDVLLRPRRRPRRPRSRRAARLARRAPADRSAGRSPSPSSRGRRSATRGRRRARRAPRPAPGSPRPACPAPPPG